MWAGIRATSSKQYLTDPAIHFAELDLGNRERLREQLLAYKAEMGGAWDYVIHAAGATKSLHREGFFRTNTDGTRNLVMALQEAGMVPQRFVFISSLSIFGAIKEQPLPAAEAASAGQRYPDITAADTPEPNTAYGESKLAAERFLASQTALPWVILRPTGVYGPRERDYFMMAKSIKAHTDFAVGFRRQDITFVYVTDVVQAVFLALDKGVTGRRYFLSDGDVYQSSTFSDLLRKELGNPWWIRITAPIWLLRVITFCGEYIGRLTGKVTALNNDKYYIMRQRNWRCDIEPARRELGYEPQVKLAEGVHRSIQWYKENKWL